jgi:iron complex outermembrane receptor protein
VKPVFCFLLFIILFHLESLSQSIRGKILDSSQTPISFIPVALLSKSDSSIYKGTLSDEKGIYFFDKVKQGTYILKFEGLGYKIKYSSEIKTDSLSQIQIPDVMLTTGVNLEEIAITANKKTIEFKNGNIIVNVENSPLAKGNTVYDLLSKLPGVSIDDNTILLNGKAGAIIMIDGRIEQLTNIQILNLLKSMSTELVEKIELLKNPPAKYDASGTSGMINIKTKKAKLVGFSGSAYTSNSQGFYARSMSGVSLNYKAEKFALFSNFDYNYSYYQTTEKFNKKFSDSSVTTTFNGVGALKDLEKNINYKFGADWLPNKKNTIGFKIDGGPGSYTSNGDGSNTITGYNNLNFDHLNSALYNLDKWNINNYNINAEHRFDTVGTTLSFTSDYTKLTETNSSTIQNIFQNADNTQALPPNIYASNNTSQSDIFASKLDFTKKINAKSSLELGAKINFISTFNNYLFQRKNDTTGTYFKDTTLSNNFTYKEQTYAVYANYIKSFDKVNMQVGLRGENTNLIGRNTEKGFEINRHYYNIFPTISLEYAASKNHNFQLNFNRRIDRPQYSNLNPFRYYRDQYSFYEGNPFLQPHYSNTAEITHSYKEFITNTLTYTRINNVMVDYTEQNDATKVTTETIKNMRFNNYFAYSVFIRHDIKNWWNISTNGLVAYIQYVGDVNGAVFDTKSIYYNASLTNTFIVHKNTKFEIMGVYRGPKNNGLTQVKSRWMVSFAIKRTFFNGKLDGSIGVNDIFYTFIGRTYVNFNNQNWNYYQTTDTRRIFISLNYNFGKLKIKGREVSSNEQEKARLSH